MKKTLQLFMTLIFLSMAPLYAINVYASTLSLESIQKTFDSNLEKIKKDQDKAIQSLQATHIKDMQALETRMQKEGKLEAILIIRSEIARFEKTKTITDANLSTELLDLRTLQMNYLKKVEEVPVTFAKRIVLLSQQYDLALSNLQKKITQENKIDEALKIKQERDSIEQRKEVASAQFTVADAVAYNTPPPEKTQKAIDKPTPIESIAPKNEKSLISQRKFTGSDSNRVRKRFTELSDLILKQDWDACNAYVDPNYIKRNGTREVKMHLESLVPLLRATDDPRRKLAVDKITIDPENGNIATLIPKLWAHNSWNVLKANNWVLNDGEWYLTIGGHEDAFNAQNSRRDNRKEKKLLIRDMMNRRGRR